MIPTRTLASSAALLAVFTLSAAPALAAAPEPMRFKSAEIEFPSSDRIFPGGHEAEAINNNCLACHSAGMVLTQPHLSKAEWQGEVTKMINVYKAPVDQADVAAIVDYLAAMKPQP
ncbi:hypothetical protein SAMN05216360_101499 [Methylobacterium phyllostachyos]|uniref:Sulfite dehydrogenase (Cytochrome) subunit SorB n=1 Tax=Methylobacterium phyllostachyos TaxID=582672 RepID=A0A1G9S5H6_9HYPH|nr:cytochrome c [Methylobacterium phyllostachyos]SDM30674.1 hypothetical protein SAMN05216360_101499 [Methylobacterium phyllostachyos]